MFHQKQHWFLTEDTCLLQWSMQLSYHNLFSFLWRPHQFLLPFLQGKPYPTSRSHVLCAILAAECAGKEDGTGNIGHFFVPWMLCQLQAVPFPSSFWLPSCTVTILWVHLKLLTQVYLLKLFSISFMAYPKWVCCACSWFCQVNDLFWKDRGIVIYQIPHHEKKVRTLSLHFLSQWKKIIYISIIISNRHQVLHPVFLLMVGLTTIIGRLITTLIAAIIKSPVLVPGCHMSIIFCYGLFVWQFCFVQMSL